MPCSSTNSRAVAERAVVFRRVKKEKMVTSAERMLLEEVLGRLRSEARKIKVWVKAKKAGLTQDVVDEIGRRWKRSELVMVKFVEPLCRNMDRAMEIVEVSLVFFTSSVLTSWCSFIEW